MKTEKLIPDTSVIIEGLVSKKIRKKEISPKTIIIHEAVLSELEHQANMNKSIGFLGLDEIKKIKNVSAENGIEIQFLGRKPSAAEIKYAKLGEIDSMIRDLAYEEDGTLFTADKVQAKVAEAKSINLIFEKVEMLHKKLKLEGFFDNTTMSVHLKENVKPYAKRGMPGNWEFVEVKNKKMTREEIQDISREIVEEASVRRDSFVEIERAGSTIVQLSNFRIVIVKPPFSDGWEITAVRPVKRLTMEEYSLSEKLYERIEKQAEGILIAGSPGMGKSTFAQALAEFYSLKGRIVKTVEAPRDLVLPDDVTQYAISHGDAQEIHDILLLSRPDNTIFDEMRNTDDFRLFADLRLSGIGLAGVVHATNPIDAIQRFVGRIELGVIPQVIDTVIFIKNGQIDKVLSLNMTVKVPSGMTEADLARPVVVVNDFDTQKLEYELYSYGEETVVIPVKSGEKKPSHGLAEKSIEKQFRKYATNAKVEMVSDHKCIVYVPESDISKIIGKQGKNISNIEKEIGISIDIQELEKEPATSQELDYNPVITKKAVVFELDNKAKNKDVDVYVGEDYLLSAKVGKTGVIKIHRNNKIGRILTDEINMGNRVRLVVK
ncbi:Flp pilus assembly complex ATPase component TadA [Candidatus Woesearchaeota archaeon]|nr:Flp pilus assembly complex ATPase component TadA [Candidatus Woesearchaeota archaeon]